MSDKKRILVVEDEKTISDIVVFNLKKAGFDVLTAYDGIDGAKKAIEEKPDLVLLDVMLPGMDGWEILQKVREVSTVPIIMLTARVEEDDKVRGLELGADDYITKPFGIQELTARVRANLRRSAEYVSQTKTSVFGDLTIDLNNYSLSKNGVQVELSGKEFALVSFLAQNSGKVYSREDLMSEVWGYDGYFGDVRAVDVMIRRIREKLEDDPSEPQYIKTKRGIGYYFGV